MHPTRQPLPVWFWVAYSATTPTPGMSALQLQRQHGVKRYVTAFRMHHKLRDATVRPLRDRIGAKWPVEVDETYDSGATRGEGARFHRRQVPSAGLPNRKQEALEPVVLYNVQPGTKVRTDGSTGYDTLQELGYRHSAVLIQVEHIKTYQHLPMIRRSHPYLVDTFRKRRPDTPVFLHTDFWCALGDPGCSTTALCSLASPSATQALQRHDESTHWFDHPET